MNNPDSPSVNKSVSLSDNDKQRASHRLSLSDSPDPQQASDGQAIKNGMRRTIDWKGGIWFGMAIIVLITFTVGGVASLAGGLTYIILPISMAISLIFIPVFIELTEIFPNKTGGISISSGIAWSKYFKPLAPLGVWCYWLAWIPVIPLSCQIIAGAILNLIAPLPAQNSLEILNWFNLHGIGSTVSNPSEMTRALEDSYPILRNWSLWQGSIGSVGFSFNFSFLVGVFLLLVIYSIQHRGIYYTVKVQRILGWIFVVILSTATVFGLLKFGGYSLENFSHLVPPAAVSSTKDGNWDRGGWSLIATTFIVVGWATYAIEMVCNFASEYKKPEIDIYRAMKRTGLLCMVAAILVPLIFQGALGAGGLIEAGYIDGSKIGELIVSFISNNNTSGILLSIGIIFTLLSMIMETMPVMEGPSRSIYQASLLGWVPKFFNHLNSFQIPSRAIWLNFFTGLVLLAILNGNSSFFAAILVASNVTYIVIIILAVCSIWLHRYDRPNLPRAHPVSVPIMVLATAFALINSFWLGMSLPIFGTIGIWIALVFLFIALLLFFWRHYIQDKGIFPKGEITTNPQENATQVLSADENAQMMTGATPVANVEPRQLAAATVTKENSMESSRNAGIVPWLLLLAAVGFFALGYWLSEVPIAT